MSMISAQIDELRKMADGQATYRDARAVMLQAADTIWELRDDLQRANAENAKLREQVASLTDRSIRMADKMDCLYAENEHMRLKDIAVMGELGEENERLKAENARLREERDHWHVEQVHAYGNWEDAHKRAIELEKQNAKLRELLRAAYNCTNAGPSCLECRVVAGGCTLLSAMRELGVEVEG